MKTFMNKRNIIGASFAVLALVIVLICIFVVLSRPIIGKQDASVYLDRNYSVKDNKIIPASDAKLSQNHGHFFFKKDHHFYYEGRNRDDGNTYELMKGTYSRSSKNLIVMNITWDGVYDESRDQDTGSFSSLVDNTDDDYYKLYMTQDNSGKVTGITDYYNGSRSGGILEKPGRAVRGGAIEDPVYLYKSARYGK